MSAWKSGELFAGVGGLGLAVDAVFGTDPAWFCEFDDAPSKVLAFHHPDVPNFGDVRAVDFAAVEHTAVRSGGFPCQDVSLAGRRRGMKEGTRSGLWSEFARSISEDRPEWIVIENVRGLLSAPAYGDVEPCTWCMGDGHGEHALRALGAVLGDLADLGFDAEWRGLQASDVGAPHGRFRVFILAWPAERTLPWSPTEWMRPDVIPPLAPVENMLPTPIVSDGTGGPKNLEGARFAPQMREIVQLLPTATASDADASGGSNDANVTLTDAVVRTNLGATANPRHLLPTPGAYDGERGGSQHPDKRRAGGHSVSVQDVAENLTLLGTPRTAQGITNNLRDPAVVGNPRGWLEDQVSLLPTPVVNDMGEGKTVEHWDDWTETMRGKHGNGNGHGKSLAIEAQRMLLPTPTVGNATGGNARRGGPRGDEALLPGLAVQADSGDLMPTPRATRGGSSTEPSYGLGGSISHDERTQGQVSPGTNWGPYAAAISRAEAVVGRSAPSPVRHDGKGGKARLNPELTEWMMMFPEGHVTNPAIGITRAEQLKACGNGVVPLQAATALRMMLARPGVPPIRAVSA